MSWLFGSKKTDEEADEEGKDDFGEEVDNYEVKYLAEWTYDFDQEGVVSFLIREAEETGSRIPGVCLCCLTV